MSALGRGEAERVEWLAAQVVEWLDRQRLLVLERDALRAERDELRDALRAALTWLPDPAVHREMGHGVRRELDRIRALTEDR